MLTLEDLSRIRANGCPRCAHGETCPAHDLDAHRELVAFSRRLLAAIVQNVPPELLADQQYRRELAGRAWRLACEHDEETRQ